MIVFSTSSPAWGKFSLLSSSFSLGNSLEHLNYRRLRVLQKLRRNREEKQIVIANRDFQPFLNCGKTIFPNLIDLLVSQIHLTQLDLESILTDGFL